MTPFDRLELAERCVSSCIGCLSSGQEFDITPGLELDCNPCVFFGFEALGLRTSLFDLF